MSMSLEALESRRSALLRQIQLLGDFRPGSMSATSGRCGNPRCRCRQPDHPGHGPNLRLTFRRNGKTVTVSLPSEAARRNARREVEEFQRWQQLSREYVEVNTEICQARSVDQTLSRTSSAGAHACRLDPQVAALCRPPFRLDPSFGKRACA